MAEIKITAEPQGHTRCTFTVDHPVFAGVRRFSSAEDAKGSSLAEAIFAIDGVSEVLVSGSKITVSKTTSVPWQTAGPLVGKAIRAAFDSGKPVVAARTANAAGEAAQADDDALYDKIADIFENRINPMVAGHGGHVDLIDVQDGVVMLRLGGGCQGCGMADVTLRQGIETTLHQLAPEVQGVVDVTDHSSGANPYFASAKK